MPTWGLDLATDPRHTGLVSVDWSRGGDVKVHPRADRGLDALVERILETSKPKTQAEEADVWAVDVPFGWPYGFAEFLATHFEGPALVGDIDEPRPWDSVSHRLTDRVSRADQPRGLGFNVSFDKLGATAAAWSLIEFRLHQRGMPLDRSGPTGSAIIETWPAAAWRRWAPGSASPANSAWPAMADALARVVICDGDTRRQLSAKSGHTRDALVCALVARAHSLRQTTLPTPQEASLARREGWIHLPKPGCALKDLGTAA
jgi:hypothetical protein